MNDRIRELRKALKLSQKNFANQIGLKQNSVSYMESPGSPITEQNIKPICYIFDVNEAWLRIGKGKMFTENNKRQKEFFAIFNKLAPELRDHLIKTFKDLLDTQHKLIGK